MNNLDQVTLKLNRTAKTLRQDLSDCIADTRTLTALAAPRIDGEDLQWLQGKLAGLERLAGDLRDDGFLFWGQLLTDAAGRLRQGAFDRVGWQQVLPAESALVDRLCDREAAVLQGLEQLARLRDFLHGVLRSMLTGMDEGGMGF